MVCGSSVLLHITVLSLWHQMYLLLLLFLIVLVNEFLDLLQLKLNRSVIASLFSHYISFHLNDITTSTFNWQMDGQTDDRTDRQMTTQTTRQTTRQTYRHDQTDRLMTGQTYNQTYRWPDRQIDDQTDRQMTRQTDRRPDRQTRACYDNTENKTDYILKPQQYQLIAVIVTVSLQPTMSILWENIQRSPDSEGPHEEKAAQEDRWQEPRVWQVLPDQLPWARQRLGGDVSWGWQRHHTPASGQVCGTEREWIEFALRFWLFMVVMVH